MSLFRPLSFLSVLDMDNILPASPLSHIASSAAVYLFGTAVYNLWFHPLRHIPGPWYAAISPLYLTVKDLQFVKGKCTSNLSYTATGTNDILPIAHVVHDMVTKYGGIARIAPNQVAFVEQAGIRTVYGGSSKFDKSVFYKVGGSHFSSKLRNPLTLVHLQALITNDNDHCACL